MTILDIVQQLVNGLGLGGGYALMAIGITLVWGIAKTVNFAHGNFAMITVVASVGLLKVFNNNIFLTILIGTIIAIILAFVTNLVIFKPFRHAHVAGFVGGIAISVFIEGLASLIFGHNKELFPRLNSLQTLQIGGENGVNLTVAALLMFGASVVIAVAVHLLIKKTRFGLGLRAISEDIEVASLMGVNAETLMSLTFALSGIIAGAAGILIANYFEVSYTGMANGFTVKAFTAAALGGVGSLPGAFLGGMILALSETFGVALVPSDYQDAFAFVILILILLIRPWGLLGEKE